MRVKDLCSKIVKVKQNLRDFEMMRDLGFLIETHLLRVIKKYLMMAIDLG